jgi:hypothetical protein
MKITTNEKLIKRNSKMGRIASYVGLAVMAGSMFVTFRYPQWIILAYILLFGGLGLSQLGLYYGNRWGRRPRPDEQIDQALKGLDDRFSLYHYTTPTRHLLVGPAGIWIIMPYYQTGKIVYENGRWKQKGGGFFDGYKRLFFQEGIGRPDLEIPAEVHSIEKYLQKKLPNTELPEPRAALVFTNDRTVLDIENAPIPTISASKLKEIVRKAGKEKSITPEKVRDIQDALSLL